MPSRREVTQRRILRTLLNNGASTRLPGHTLLGNGEPYSRNGFPLAGITRDSIGHAACSCGATSVAALPSQAQRKMWHADHKIEILEKR